VRISQGLRHSLITAGVVLAAPMSMAAASIEGSPLRDAIRAPFESLGLVSAEERGNGPALEETAAAGGEPAPETEGTRTSGDLQADGPEEVAEIEAGADANAAPATPTQSTASAPAASAPAAAPLAPTVDAEPGPADEPEVPPAEPEPALDDVLDDPLELVPEAVEGLP
jgi:cytoskeletal protein RodZ